jgi:hypothetical protein
MPHVAAAAASPNDYGHQPSCWAACSQQQRVSLVYPPTSATPQTISSRPSQWEKSQQGAPHITKAVRATLTHSRAAPHITKAVRATLTHSRAAPHTTADPPATHSSSCRPSHLHAEASCDPLASPPSPQLSAAAAPAGHSSSSSSSRCWWQ